MASKAKLRERIAELIGRPTNVDYEDIKWVMDQLGASSRTTKHTVMFKIPGNKMPSCLTSTTMERSIYLHIASKIFVTG
jgi:hypothetical protein